MNISSLLLTCALALPLLSVHAQTTKVFTPRPMPQHRQKALLPARDLPVFFGPQDQTEFNTYIVIDANEDEKSWKYEKDYTEGGTMCYESMGAPGGADDYLILPAVNFPSAGSYDITFKAKQLYRPEQFEIGLSREGSSADYISLYECTSVANSYTVYSASISVPEGGVWHPVIHATSPAAGLSLNICQLQINLPEVTQYDIPFFMEPTAVESTKFKFVDANNDGKCWGYDSSNSAISYEYHPQNAANDYAVLPAVNIPAPGRYRMSFDARAVGQNTETFEIYHGSTDRVDEMTSAYSASVTGSTVVNHGVTVEIPEAGDYYFAVKCTSPANRFKLVAKNFRIELSTEAEPVALPADFAVNDITWDTFTSTGNWTPSDDGATLALTAGEESWLISPPFMSGEAMYLLYNLRAKVAQSTHPVTIEMYIGDVPSPGAMRKISTTDGFLSTSYSELEQLFGMDGSDKRCHIGIKLYGASDNEVTINNMKVSAVDDSGESVPLPFSMQPTEEEFSTLRVINANNDESTWTYYAPFGAARYNFNLHNDADDWLILPAVNVENTSHLHHFSLNCRGMSTNKLAEYFEIWMGTTPDPASMQRIYASPAVLTEVFTPYGFYFSIPQTGATYFAVRAVSPKNSFHLFVRDFVIEETHRSVMVPAEPENIETVAGETGALHADVTVTLPLMNAAAQPLDASTPITLRITSAAAEVTTQALPGETKTLRVATLQGDNDIEVVCSNAAGLGLERHVSVYTGQDTPLPVDNIRVSVSADNRTMHVEWTPQTTGVRGGYVDPSLLTYELQHSTGVSYSRVAQLDGTTSYDYTIPASYPLEVHYMRVTASNVAGSADPGRGKGAVMGRPYEIPMNEEFEQGEITHGPIMIDKPNADYYRASWYFDNPALAFDESGNESGRAMVAFTEDYGPAGARLVLPKVSTLSATGARVVLRVYNYPHFPTTSVYAETFGTEPVKVGEIAPSSTAGWHEYTFALPESMLDKQWVDWIVDAAFAGTDDDEIFMLDKYGVSSLFASDVEMRRLSAPVLVHVDDTLQIEALLLNNGTRSVTLPTPELTLTMPDGTERHIQPLDCDQTCTLAFGESKALSYSMPTIIDDMGMIPYSITAEFAEDQNPDDNVVTGGFEIRPDYEFTIFDLKADVADDEVTLTWSMPMLDEGYMNVEYLDAFDYGSKLGLWTNVDRDNKPTLSFQTASYPGMGKAKGWQVFNYQLAYFPDIYCGHNQSDQCFMVTGPADGSRADDWLISPKVKGGTDVKFYVRPLNYAYGPERIEVLASATPDPADFVSVRKFSTIDGAQGEVPIWEEMSATLPADAKYFAIRYYSQDIFGLLLDDITYTPALEADDPMYYNIYRDDTKIAPLQPGYTYVDTPATGTYAYTIALEAEGEEFHRSVTAYATVKKNSITDLSSAMAVRCDGHMVEISGAEDMTCIICDASGEVVFTKTLTAPIERIKLIPGVYVLKVGIHTQKLIIK